VSKRERITRRSLLAALGGAAIAALGPALDGRPRAAEPAARKNPLPRWRGVNLLEKFARGDGRRPNRPFVERDFQWLQRWGFDFARLPMDYRFWIAEGDPRRFDEAALKEIDQAVEWGRQYGVFVCVNFHRAPGYTVNTPPETLTLWTDEEAQELCELHWRMFAKRYKGIASARLGFNLWNEPAEPGRRGLTRESHARVARRVVAAIREEDPDRLIIADGMRWGQQTLPELADLGIAQSTRAYLPSRLTHYRASWMEGSDEWPVPTWPYQEGNERWDIERLRAHYRPWHELSRQGVGVHCGEGGVYRFTPHDVTLAFLRDVLTVLGEYGIGWATWNLRGTFGWIDSQRPDVQYEDLEGLRLDRKMLELLRSM